MGKKIRKKVGAKPSGKKPSGKPTIKEVAVSESIKGLLGGAAELRAFIYGETTILLAKEMGKWHISISHPQRDPTWEEIKHVRYELVPGNATMAMILPPKSEYVNLHVHCFHLWEVRA